MNAIPAAIAALELAVDRLELNDCEGEERPHIETMQRAIEGLRAEASAPDPLGEALNMGDGTYRP